MAPVSYRSREMGCYEGRTCEVSGLLCEANLMTDTFQKKVIFSLDAEMVLSGNFPAWLHCCGGNSVR